MNPLAPDPGQAVLACRCGRAVDAQDLQWIGNTRNTIRRVGCPECARTAATR